MRWQRYWGPAAVVVATLLAIELCRHAQQKTMADAAAQQSVAQQQVYSLIVGYVCHEVRNPLHVLKSSLEAMTAGMKNQTAILGHVLRSLSRIAQARGQQSQQSDDVVVECIAGLQNDVRVHLEECQQNDEIVACDGHNAVMQMQVRLSCNGTTGTECHIVSS